MKDPQFLIYKTMFFYIFIWILCINFCCFQELKQYPGLRVEVGNAAIESLERMREQSKKASLQLVDMECSYLTVDFFRKLPQDIEKGGNPTHSIFDRYNDSYLRRVGTSSTILLYYLTVHLHSMLLI